MKQIVIVLSAAILLAGCSTTMKNRAATFGLGDRATVSALYNQSAGLENDPQISKFLTAQNKTVSTLSPTDGNDAQIKDLIVGTLIARSDRYCNEFLSSVGSTQRGVNTAALIADSAFSTAGAVALTEATTKRMLGFANGAKGLRGNLNQGLFEGQSSTLIMLAVLKLRSEAKPKLITRLASGDLKGVNLGLILPFIEEYHSTCTVGHGLAEIQKNLIPASPAAGSGGK